MKAIILAGGEGTRLRPLSLEKPKPMIRLFDRPLLEHIVGLLRRCGYTELCMTLHYLPSRIREHFGDGSEFGVSIEYRTETEAAGTAGSVLACRDFIGDDDFLVISGDAACSYDLRAMMEKHRLSGAEATILVRESKSPLEFGLVLTEADGRIRGFLEKPGPERIVTDLINTGIYILSPSLLAEIPKEGNADFGADVFPRWLRQKRRLHSWKAAGYWNDVGSCEAYLETCRDVLSGRFPLPIGEGNTAEYHGPCWISPEAEVSENAILGPYTVIGSGSRVGDGCRITGCVVQGAVLGPGCTAEDSILSSGAHLGPQTQLRPGCVLAEGAFVGEGSLLNPGVRLWPGVTLPAGSIISESIHFAEEAEPLRFEVGGRLYGTAGQNLTPERLLRMGAGASAERIGAAASGGGYARLLAEAFLIGAGAEGKSTFLSDAAHASTAAAANSVFDLDMSVFFLQEGRQISAAFFDRDGLPIPRREQRKLEAASGACLPSAALHCHPPQILTGTEEAAVSAALTGCGQVGERRLACNTGLLAKALLRAGAKIDPPEDGTTFLRLSPDGMTLSVTDEEGHDWSWNMLLCALTAAELRSGEHSVVLPYDAPELAERIAEIESGTIYRLERDGEEARKLLRTQHGCRDGLNLAIRLFSLLNERPDAASFAGFMRTLPEYHRREQVVELAGADTAILRQLAADRCAETVNGVRLHEDEGCATIRRLKSGQLRILAESSKMEAAEELCAKLRRRIRQMEERG